MGNSVSSRLEWSDLAGKANTNKDSVPHLKTSVANQDLLYDLSNMVEQLALNYPSESKAEFKTPLVWTSKILPQAFTSHASSGFWVVKTDAK
jgi:armadillo repeat-containing protein 4